MRENLINLTDDLRAELIKTYRDFHKYPEPAWREFRTASIVVKTLQKLGYDICYGGDVIKEEAMMDVPSLEEIAKHQKRAVEQGGDPEIIAKMVSGKTGVMAVLDTGRPGSTVAFRFDMDANELDEVRDPKHRPFAEGFASVNQGAMHACGHDAHTAIGLGVAQVLAALRDDLHGKIKLIFQPAEEGVRGARSMVEAGIVDDVDYMIGAHVGISLFETGHVMCGSGVNGFTATTKYDVVFKGVQSHAGNEPEAGHNALLAAATAAVNLHAISRHSLGLTRINVGSLIAGSGRNIIPGVAEMKIETRGATNDVNKYMEDRAYRILAASADMYEVDSDIKVVGSSASSKPNEALAEKIAEIASGIQEIKDVQVMGPFGKGAAEDYTYFMNRVQELGGMATYILLGTELAAGHHNPYFDINEDVIPLGVKFLSMVAQEISKTHPPASRG